MRLILALFLFVCKSQQLTLQSGAALMGRGAVSTPANAAFRNRVHHAKRNVAAAHHRGGRRPPTSEGNAFARRAGKTAGGVHAAAPAVALLAAQGFFLTSPSLFNSGKCPPSGTHAVSAALRKNLTPHATVRLSALSRKGGAPERMELRTRSRT